MKKTIFTSLCLLLAYCAAYSQFRKRITPSRIIDEQNLNYANPAEYFIGGIRIEGLRVLDENAILSLTGLKVGDKIKLPGEQISGAIRKLWKHGLVGDASIAIDRIEGENIFLVITLAERPRLTGFSFTGVNGGHENGLKDDLSLIRGKIVNDVMIKNTENTVRQFFVKKGFLNTEVKVVQQEDTTNGFGVRLRIDVKKNHRVRIHQIVLNGSKNLSPARLKAQMKKTKEYARFTLPRALIGDFLALLRKEKIAPLDSSKVTGLEKTKRYISQHVKLNAFASSKLIQSTFEEDKEAIIKYYNTQGYRDAVILSDTIIKRPENKVDILISLYEGRKYYFRNITWVGNYVHNDATLNTILDIKKGSVYNQELITRRITYNPRGADVSSLYMDDGYLFFRITPVEVAVDGDSIDIEMRIFEGEQATIRDVRVSGNTRTNDHVILRELNTVPGQKFSRADVIRTQQLLSQMGFFDPQKIEPDIRPNFTDGTVDIDWKLEEQSNDQVQLSGGWGGAFGFVGTVGVTFNNFSLRNIPHLEKWKPLPVGDGQRLSLSLQANGFSYQNYRVSFTEPWLGGRKPNSLTVDFNHSVSRQTTANFRVDQNVLLRQNGFSVSFGRRLEWPDNYFTLIHTFSLLHYEYKGNYFYSSVFPSSGETFNIKLETTLARSSIDNPIYPTRGSTISLNVALTPPYSLIDPSYTAGSSAQFRFVEMHKWMFDAKFYLKLLGGRKPNSRSLVLETGLHLGFIGKYNQSITQGPFERFLLGGDGLAGGFNAFVLGQDVIGLRGYTNNSITPPLYALRGSTSSDRIEGGIAYSKVAAELRYPITMGQAATIYALVFAEGGNNWGSFDDINFFKIYKSAGVGLRLFMPAFGLIGLNWGYGFDVLPGSSTPSGPQFHFTIGQQIR